MITKFKLFESHQEISQICDRFGIQNWEINPKTGRVDVRGGVDLFNQDLKKLPLHFGVVTGYFDCSYNQLKSLEGGPQSVGGGFYCGRNQLTSLEGGPQSVGSSFDCGDNQLKSLEGSPQSVGGYFDCGGNQLTSLELSPQRIGGDFYCNNNQIVDFKVPEYSLNDDRRFYCDENPIYEIYYLFQTPKCIDLINEFDVIRPNRVIIRDRLEEVFSVLGMKIPESFDFREWELVD